MVNSRCYRAEILHRRYHPVHHEFRYLNSVLQLDLDELAELSRQHRWFGYGCRAPVSIQPQDYLLGESCDLREQLRQVLQQRGWGQLPARVVLVTSPRIFGYVFNPVNFWLGYNQQDALEFVLAEVNNTFGERHLYLLTDPTEGRIDCDKAFYVSPFAPVEGQYHFKVGVGPDRLDIAITTVREGLPGFEAQMRGGALPFSLAGLLASRPWNIFLTQPRIHWQAAKLYFQKKLPLVARPRPLHRNTIKAEPPSWLHRQAISLVHGFLQRAVRGRLLWVLPNNQILEFGDPKDGQPPAQVKLWNWDLYFRLLWQGDVAFGDGYVEGDWESEDPTAVIAFFAHNREVLDDREIWWGRWLGRLLGWLEERGRANTLAGSRRNIEAHYDLSNQLYANFLDEEMVYSCAIFEPGDSLEMAQQRKLNRLTELAQLGPGQKLLEIGSGWGALAKLAARAGCQVLGLTLSKEQLAWSQQAVQLAGLQDSVEFRLQDYRQTEGQFDRILSCEMLEAVGVENLDGYFENVERLLRPGGIAVFQVITFPERYYQQYCRSQDWIQKRIFPGGHCPSLPRLLEAVSKRPSLAPLRIESIGPHYATTLNLWRQRFEKNWPQILQQGGSQFDERFARMWSFYFSYCEAGFETGHLDVHQIVLRKEQL